MSYRKSNLPAKQEEDEDIVEFPLVRNDIKEGIEKMNTDAKSKSDKLNFGEDLKINENLLKLIEDIVIKNLKRNTVESSNTRANQQNLKILDAKSKITLRSKAIKKKSKTPLKKIKKISAKTGPKPPVNWIYVK